MKRLFNRCHGWRKQISLLAAGALSEIERDEVEGHLASCAHCRRYFEEVKAVSSLLAGGKDDFAMVEPSRESQARWRKDILAAAESSVSPSSFLTDLWRELLWPCRRVITGAAAAWLIMWAANAGILGSPAGIAGGNNHPVTGAWQNYAEQRQFFAELINTQTAPPAEPPRRSVPKPRGDVICRTKFC